MSDFLFTMGESGKELCSLLKELVLTEKWISIMPNEFQNFDSLDHLAGGDFKVRLKMEGRRELDRIAARESDKLLKEETLLP
jgi:hypothetical protein